MLDKRQRRQLAVDVTHVSKVVGALTVWQTYYRGTYSGDVWRAPGRKYRHWTNSRRSAVGHTAHVFFDNRIDASLDLLGYDVARTTL